VGHTLVVKGFSTHPDRRVLLVDPAQLCPPGRDCEGELDEGFWISYDEYATGWGGRVHWVDFYGIRPRRRENRWSAPRSSRWLVTLPDDELRRWAAQAVGEAQTGVERPGLGFWHRLRGNPRTCVRLRLRTIPEEG
jgi:hypothetical protein